jgi:hypothetical protein
MRRTITLVLSLALIAAGSLLSGTSESLAHERRTVGSYTFVVGWVTEPAYVNFANAVDLRVSRSADSAPVTGLQDTLKVEVTQGSKKVELAFRPRSNTPGAYDGRMFPTAVGDYSFRIFGTIEGNQINETFTSGPNTFGSILAPEGFPNPLPINQQLDESLGGIEQRVLNLEGDSSGGTDTAMVLSIIAIIVGTAGLVVGGLSLTRKSTQG